ncbi:MAG: hypothetical protein IT383_07035 [Deltaproteobacteria bacterium]|nr:hypothetical protein [Deltaproteobacteria bacterium]
MRLALLRAGIILLALPLLAALIARPPVPALPLVLGGLGLVLGYVARSAMLLVLVRRGAVAVAPDGGARSALLGNLAAGVLGAALAAPFAIALEGYARAAIFLGGVAAMFPAAAIVLRDLRHARATRAASTLRWLLLWHALPSGLLAAGAGAGALWLRLHALDVVPPGELARHFGGTTCLYALLLGLGGVVKGYAEVRHRLVVVTLPLRPMPGPILPGVALGVALLLLAPLMPPLPFGTVLALKVALGVVVGGALSALGALRGAREAQAPGAPSAA